jgi:predicted flap endonuclease-1-like 5' DNA nuclease
MIYLIGQLAPFLLLTAGFAAWAGWAYATERASPGEAALRRERDRLVRDIVALGVGDGGGASIEAEREIDGVRRAVELRDGRIVALEQALANARSRANDAMSQVAELQRRSEQREVESAGQLRTPMQIEPPAHALVVESQPANEEQSALQTWRLRYFEQRVRYLEGRMRDAPSAPDETPTSPPVTEWRAREAEARAAHLETELRAAVLPGNEADAVSPFAANADVDVLLRWRLLYLERRVAHLQGSATPLAVALPAQDAAPDRDRWKWRARYLEARVRHLEQSPSAPMNIRANVVETSAPAPAIAPPRADAAKPPILPAARNGGPDDLTLIEDVSVLQQTTLYSIGVFHFDQIAAWTPANVAWVDQYLRLRGRIDDEEWLEQARDLSRDGVDASRRLQEEEDA